MRITLFIILFFQVTFVFGRSGNDPQVDSLLNVLNKVIDQREYYENLKKQKIDSLLEIKKHQLPQSEEMYSINRKLVVEYRSYIYDIALMYVLENLSLAQQLANEEMVNDSKIMHSNILISGGLYKEALDVLLSMNRKKFTRLLTKRYYYSMEQVYHHMALYAMDNTYSPRYNEISTNYLDSARLFVDPHSNEYLRLTARLDIKRGNIDAGTEKLKVLLSQYDLSTRDYAMLASTLASTYTKEADSNEKMKYLILSSMSDMMSSVKENEALRDLSLMLFNEGKIDLAYKYSTISLEDADIYNARLRRIEISKVQPVIEKAHTEKIDAQNRKLKITFVVISSLIIILICVLITLYVQFRMIKRSKKNLQTANSQLKDLNLTLTEANTVKQEYIGYYLSVCSSYINKLDQYRTFVYSRIKTGKIDELRAVTRSSENTEEEVKDFYNNFDQSFTKLYPNFIKEFNNLLRQEEAVVPEKDDLLTPELRIFALMRLGIQDSSKIATFLRYSPNTVYSYRTKIKNKAKNRDSFDEDILRIGL